MTGCGRRRPDIANKASGGYDSACVITDCFYTSRAGAVNHMFLSWLNSTVAARSSGTALKTFQPGYDSELTQPVGLFYLQRVDSKNYDRRQHEPATYLGCNSYSKEKSAAWLDATLRIPHEPLNYPTIATTHVLTGYGVLSAGKSSDVMMEQLRNARAREMGEPRENPPTSGIVQHVSHISVIVVEHEKSRATRRGQVFPSTFARYVQFTRSPRDQGHIPGPFTSCPCRLARSWDLPPRASRKYKAGLGRAHLTSCAIPNLFACRDIKGPAYRLAAANSKHEIPHGATVAERLARSPPTKANRAQYPAESPNFRKWELCRTMPLVGAFSRGSPVSLAPQFRRHSIFTSITLIGSRDLAIKSRHAYKRHSAFHQQMY
ncbi:hypothetical protein PR048_021319 [Dryococelus australis]|uniref:Uncharacterized protein n=1 Tax=Dryococelus australis TaxID=614101 RepID=A0ABQ9GXW1_9NEOP|nr:hypothetical protein PR048_021319 [Dryococelus australis]